MITADKPAALTIFLRGLSLEGAMCRACGVFAAPPRYRVGQQKPEPWCPVCRANYEHAKGEAA